MSGYEQCHRPDEEAWRNDTILYSISLELGIQTNVAMRAKSAGCGIAGWGTKTAGGRAEKGGRQQGWLHRKCGSMRRLRNRVKHATKAHPKKATYDVDQPFS